MENRKDCHETSLEQYCMVSLGYEARGVVSARNLQDRYEIIIVYHVMFNQAHEAVVTEHNRTDSYLQKIRFLYPFAVNIRSSFLY